MLAFFSNVKNYYENIPRCLKSITIPKWVNGVKVPPTGSPAWEMLGASLWYQTLSKRALVPPSSLYTFQDSRLLDVPHRLIPGPRGPRRVQTSLWVRVLEFPRQTQLSLS